MLDSSKAAERIYCFMLAFWAENCTAREFEKAHACRNRSLNMAVIRITSAALYFQQV